DSRDARFLGRTRKVRVYALTEAGVRRARQILGEVDATHVEIEGRATTLGEARRDLGLPALPALAAIDSHGRLQPPVTDLGRANGPRTRTRRSPSPPRSRMSSRARGSSSCWMATRTSKSRSSTRSPVSFADLGVAASSSCLRKNRPRRTAVSTRDQTSTRDS